MIFVGTFVVACALLVTLAALFGMGRRRAVGDEASYLEGPGGPAPHLFVRIPVLNGLAALCRRTVGAERLRWLLALVSVATVGVTLVVGWSLGGPSLGILAAVLFLLQPERIVLACHVWPDVLLALLTTLVVGLLALPVPLADPVLLALGLVCALGSLTRIDFLAVPVLVWASLLLSGQPVDSGGLLRLLGPTIAALLLWSLRNYFRYGIALPDNTWVFNLMVAEAETRLDNPREFVLEPLIEETVSRWHTLPESEKGKSGLRVLWATLGRPGHFLRSVARRALTLCGPDTFVRQKLLPRSAAYPDLDARVRRAFDLPLQMAFPLLLTLAGVGFLLRGEGPPLATWPVLGLFAISALFLARTRNRMVVLPTFSILAAQGLLALPTALASSAPWELALLASAPFVFWALARIPSSRELPS